MFLHFFFSSGISTRPRKNISTSHTRLPMTAWPIDVLGMGRSPDALDGHLARGLTLLVNVDLLLTESNRL